MTTATSEPVSAEASPSHGGRTPWQEGKWARPVQGTAVVAALLGLWELLSRGGVLNPHFVPPPSEVIRTWYDWIFGGGEAAGHRFSGTWMTHVLSSGQRVLGGFLIAALLGVVLGVLIGWFRVVGALLDPIVQLLRPIPVTAWVPFAIVFFGLSAWGAIALIALGAFFPIVVNSTAGAQRTPRMLVRAALMLGTPRRKLLWRVVLPSALPSIFTGLRLGMGVAWVLVIVAEMLAVRSGLGYVMWDAYQLIRMDLIVATMVSVGVLGFLFDVLLVGLRKWALGWSEGMFE